MKKNYLFIIIISLIFIVLIIILMINKNKSNNPNGYQCPKGYWNCMPGPGPARPNCSSEYINWAIKNCGGKTPAI